jgi:tight adherence protein C
MAALPALDPGTLEPRLVLLAALCGLGVYLVVTGLPLGVPKPDLGQRLDRLDVDERVRMDLEARDVRPLFSSRLLEHLLRPVVEDAGRLLRGLFARLGLGDLGELERKLRLVRPEVELPQFFGEKLISGIVFGCTPVLANVLGVQPFGVWPLWLWLAAFAAGFFVPDWQLERAVAARRTRCLMELPPLVDLLLICLSSGMGEEQALIQAARHSHGTVAGELERALREAGIGQRDLMDALAAVADRNGVPELTAFVSQLRAAHGRGLPLVQALSEQSEMLRDGKRTRLLEAGGKATKR